MCNVRSIKHKILVVSNYLVLQYFLFTIIFIIFLSACKKLVEVDSPSTSITSENVYNNDVTAAAVLTGVYTSFSSTGVLTSGNVRGISIRCGLSADELNLFGTNANLIAFYRNALTTGTNQTFWENLYNNLYTVNLAIERLTNATTLTPSVKNQLEGEAKFMRAFFLFYLVNFYGDVPLTISTDYRINAVITRTPKIDIYQQMISDLKDAQNKLAPNYVGADAKGVTTERVRPNKWAATALLARIYLYNGDWSNAETQSSDIIANKTLYDTVSLNDVFLKNSKEAIWQLQPVNIGWNTEEARVFILTGAPNNSRPVYISPFLFNSFEPGDSRKTNWVGTRVSGATTYYYPNKYKSATNGAPVTEYLMMLRLSEQYLIRAEARVQQNNFTGAKSDLNVVRMRSELANTAADDKASLQTAILHERQVELFTEWGHRWLDLKRTNAINDVMTTVTPQKGGAWETTDQLYPLPLYEITQNSNLLQNDGY